MVTYVGSRAGEIAAYIILALASYDSRENK